MVNVKVIIIKDQGAMFSYFPKKFSTTIKVKLSGFRQFFRRSRGLFFAKSFIINDRRLSNIGSFSTTSGGNGTNFGYFFVSSNFIFSFPSSMQFSHHPNIFINPNLDGIQSSKGIDINGFSFSSHLINQGGLSLGQGGNTTFSLRDFSLKPRNLFIYILKLMTNLLQRSRLFFHS